MRSRLTIICILMIFKLNAQNCDSLYFLSLKEFDKQNYKKSAELVDSCIKKCTPRADIYLHAAKCNYQLRNIQLTLQNLNNSLQLNPNNVPAYALKAQLMMESEMYPQAIEMYDKILKLYPVYDSTTVIYSVNQGKAFMNTNQFDKAYSVLQSVYFLDSLNPELNTNLSVCAIQLRKFNDAEKYLNKVISYNPNYTAALINFGYLQMEKGEYQNAILSFNKVLLIQPNEAFAYNNRGFSYFKLGKFEEALEDINHSISLDPSNSYAYRNRAFVYTKTGMNNEACEDFQKALDLGFTQMYGNEVEILKKEFCAKKSDEK